MRVAGITTNFTQGSAQATGKATDMMISGDGFFVTGRAARQLFTRAGAFDLDADGQLVSPDGAHRAGLDGRQRRRQHRRPGRRHHPAATASSPGQRDHAVGAVGGNLPSDAAVGTALDRDVEVYDASGAARTLTLTFTRTAAGWDVTADDGGATATGR